MNDSADVIESATLQLLLDERDITRVLHRYATALDAKDWELLSHCFVPEASAHYESIGLLEGYPAIEDICRRALHNMTQTQHLIGNVEVSVEGDTAFSSCYLHAQHIRLSTPGGDSNIIAGCYNDQWIRTLRGWKILRRDLAVWWTAGNPAVHDALDAGS